MTIQWNDELLTGIEEVDIQHKEMFDRIISLINACNVGKGRTEVLNTFSFLENYIVMHFELEEIIMLKHNYVNYVSHVAQHHQFISVVKELKNELERDGVTSQFVIHTSKNVVEWLVFHITKEDKTLAKFIRERS